MIKSENLFLRFTRGGGGGQLPHLNFIELEKVGITLVVAFNAGEREREAMFLVCHYRAVTITSEFRLMRGIFYA
jgi:hypothetical protein